MILVVEDEQSIRKFIVLNLKHRGYEVREAVSGEDGMATIEGATPDLMLLDINLPGMSGWELLETLSARSDIPNFPVIVCSAYATDRDASRYPQISAVVSKPVEVQELLRVVKNALPNSH